MRLDAAAFGFARASDLRPRSEFRLIRSFSRAETSGPNPGAFSCRGLVMEANIALPAALIGDPARAAILVRPMRRTRPTRRRACLCRKGDASIREQSPRKAPGGRPACRSNFKAAIATIGWRRLMWRTAMEALAHLAPPIRSLDAPLTSKASALAVQSLLLRPSCRPVGRRCRGCNSRLAAIWSRPIRNSMRSRPPVIAGAKSSA